MNRAATFAISGFLALNCSAALSQENRPLQSASLAEALDFFNKSGMQTQFATYIELLAPGIVNGLRTQYPNISDRCASETETVLKEFLEDHRDDFVTQTAQAFADRFTAEELRDLATFFGSELGVKFQTVMVTAVRDGIQKPGAPKELVDGLKALQQNNLTDSNRTEVIIGLVSNYLSGEEVVRLRNFLNNGVGKKYEELNPEIVREAGRASAALLASATTTFSDRLRQSGACS